MYLTALTLCLLLLPLGAPQLTGIGQMVIASKLVSDNKTFIILQILA